MKNLTRVSGTAALILSQAVLLGACGRFSPAALTKAVTPASTAADASKTAKTTTENFSCVSKTVSLAYIDQNVSETQVTETEKTSKGQRKTTKSADGKSETIEINAEESQANFRTADGEARKQTEARTYTLNEKRETVRQQYENGVTQDDTVTTTSKKVSSGDLYADAKGQPAKESNSTVKTMSVYKVVGNETQGISKQIEKAIASADRTVTTKSVEGAVTKTVKKMTAPLETNQDGGITITQTVDDETCTFEAAK